MWRKTSGRAAWAPMGVALLCGVGVSGCASVTVRKVPTPTQYIRWSDDMQKKADRMEGIRFYLPRPFVNVFESFPVRTDIYLAHGTVSPDGKYILINRITSESGLRKYIASETTEIAVPRQLVFAATDEQVRTQSDLVQKGLEAILQFGRDRVPVGVSPTATPLIDPRVATLPPAQTTPQPPTGINERRVTNDNGAFAYQPLRGNFDIVYLPDFEEQYVVTSEANLGNAKFEVNLGQGWSLQGFNSLTDNSELTRRIFDLIDTAIRVAKTTAAFGLNALAPGLGTASLGMITPQGAALSEEGQPGTGVSLKIVVVHYAAKGLYPVIKPRELQERMRGLDVTRYCFLDLFKIDPKIYGASEFDPDALMRAQRMLEPETGYFTVPRYPYQYVSFNTFRYMAIESISPTSPDYKPFEYLYDKTGTTGDPGDRQLVDLADEIREMLRRNYAPPAVNPQPVHAVIPEQLRNAWTAALKGKRLPPGMGDRCFEIANAAFEGGNLTVTLSEVGTPDPLNAAQARQFIFDIATAEAVNVHRSDARMPERPLAGKDHIVILNPGELPHLTVDGGAIDPERVKTIVNAAPTLFIQSGDSGVGFAVQCQSFDNVRGELRVSIAPQGAPQALFTAQELLDVIRVKANERLAAEPHRLSGAVKFVVADEASRAAIAPFLL